MTKTHPSGVTPTGAWLERVRSPLLALALGALGAGIMLAQLGTRTERASRYGEVFVIVPSLAAVALVVALLLPHPSRRPKLTTSLTAGAGVALGALAFNGMLRGVSQWCVAGAALATFVVATVAILVDLESTRDRPVSRL